MIKKKVVHILHCVGGVDVYLRLILENINNEKIENIIIHGIDDTNSEFNDINNNKIKSYNVPIYREISLINDFKAIYFAYKILKDEKPDLIHCHSAKGGIIGRFLGFLLKIKVLYTPHAFSYLSSESTLKKNIYLYVERIFANKNSILLPTSKSELCKGVNEVGYKKVNTKLFTNSINEIKNIKQLTIPKTWPSKYICTVGRPSYQKNIELMIRVLKEVTKSFDTHLVIMGVGHHSDKLESVKKLIKELNLEDSVTLLNWTDRENIFNIIKNSKLYLSTARYEGLPYSVIEALALSKPCVVSDCDGNKDLIQDDYNGYVIQNENVNEYAEKIKKLLNNDKLSDEFSINALKSFDENYNIKKNISILEDIYAEYSIK